MKRRPDATYVADLNPFKRMFPFVMPKRVDSLIYHQFSLDLTEGIQFVKTMNRDQPGDHKYRVFELFLSALLRTIALRPYLNRFIMNYDCWQRKELSLNFVVKEDYTDEAPEHISIVYFEPQMTFPEIAQLVNKTIENSRMGGTDNNTDEAVEFFLNFPKTLLRLLVAIIRFLDVHGLAPKALRNADGLHASAFVANLGSISLLGSPHHHLYEWGTTSLFITMGALKRKRVYAENDSVSFVDSMEIGVTLDERIADGFYFIKSMQLLQDLLNNPEQLLARPALPQPGPTLREVKRERRKAKRLRRKQRRLNKESA